MILAFIFNHIQNYIMAILQFTVIPIGVGVSVGDYIAEIQTMLEKENCIHKLVDMGTLIEGDIDDLFSIMKKIYETPFTQGAERVVTYITIDDRRDKIVHIGGKIEAVKKRLV